MNKKVMEYQKDADELIKEIYNMALKNKMLDGIKVMEQDLLTKTLDYPIWKSYYKKFKKYLNNSILDIKNIIDFALALNCANINCKNNEKIEFEEIKTYLSEFINFLNGLKNSNSPQVLKIINNLDYALVYNNIINNIKNNNLQFKH